MSFEDIPGIYLKGLLSIGSGKVRGRYRAQKYRAKPFSAYMSPAPVNTSGSRELLSTRILSPIQTSSSKDAEGSIHRREQSGQSMAT